MTFTPDYNNIVAVANGRAPARTPLYEHFVNDESIEQISGIALRGLEPEEYLRRYCEFYRRMGYDAVPFEGCIAAVFPGGGALGDRRHDPAIKGREDFEKYPWDEVFDRYFREFTPMFRAFEKALPPGMKAIGGAGSGPFECAQDLCGYENLCYWIHDDPELLQDLFARIGDVSVAIWRRLLTEFGDSICVARFGDDLGFKSGTSLGDDATRTFVLPQYIPIIAEVHRQGKPFLLHSCGNLFGVMDDIIAAGVNAKHSNEDVIAHFGEWIDRYSDRIGLCGGVDVDALCRFSLDELGPYIDNLFAKAQGRAVAIGSGNSIPPYVPPEKYLFMVERVRKLRGE